MAEVPCGQLTVMDVIPISEAQNLINYSAIQPEKSDCENRWDNCVYRCGGGEGGGGWCC